MENKKKYAYWMLPSTVERMEKMMNEANAGSKSEFVCKAVEFYMGYLNQKKSIDFISPILASTIKSEVASVEKNLSEILFKLAVEVAKGTRINAAVHNLSEDYLSHINDVCCRDVANNNGIVSYKKAMDYDYYDDYEYEYDE